MSRFDRFLTSPHAAPLATRRAWLQRSLALGGALGTGGLANLLLGSSQPAHAADYKALVCVFLYGGNDGMNMVVPVDTNLHAQYASVRGGLAVPRQRLLPLGATGHGLHPAMSALMPLWEQGALAPVFNVGPLFEPTTKAAYRAATEDSPLVPDSLFSHSDQQVLWECAGTSSLERTGWGGRASESLGTINPVISASGSNRFGVENLRVPLVVPGPGAQFGAYGLGAQDMDWRPNLLRRQAIDAMYAQTTELDLRRAYNEQQAVAFEMSARIGPLIASRPGDALSSPAIDAAFAPLIVDGRLATPLASQLYQVAKLIANNAQVQGNRQLFFASQGGYDTHEGQGAAEGTHAALLGELADALAAFHRALANLGLGQVVTSFTQSDFGRTFAPNLSGGTDHAWGNHQLVMGEAVKGGATYGRYPELTLGGPDDVGLEAWELQGRWIPTSAVDQYAATLLRWFGSTERQLDSLLPNLPNFGSERSLGFL